MEINKKIIISSSLISLFLPILVLAAFPTTPTIGGVVYTVEGIVISILDLVWKIFVGVAVIMFMIAGIQFLTAQGDPGKIATARQSVIWGSVGIVVAIIAFSIISIIDIII